jgi:tungstate transport system substrate-binding protein
MNTSCRPSIKPPCLASASPLFLQTTAGPIVAFRGVVFLAILAFVVGCSRHEPDSKNEKPLRLGSTTSVQNSGLLDELVQSFHKSSNIEVLPIAAGSGQVLEMARRGDLDIVIVHSPKAEDELVADGFGLKRHTFMQNNFVIAGPPSDPANCKGAKTVNEALHRIVAANSTWLSRDDESGTNVREQQLWNAAKINTSDWASKRLIKTGQGMGATLRIAGEKSGYTLTDNATLVMQQATHGLRICFEGDETLANVYSMIVVNPQKNPHANITAASAFVDFVKRKETLKLISNFGPKGVKEGLFTPID